jgi:transcriptional regulator with XRE-family HTH domain
MTAPITKHERLREARIKAGFSSASAGALAVGVSKATYIHHENGTRGFDENDAATYAKYFSSDAAWLLLGDEQVETPTKAGSAIYALRKAKGLTQTDLAERLGIHWVTISKLERGVIQITEKKAVEIAKALDVDVSQIWGTHPATAGVTIVAAAIFHGAVISLPAPARHHTILYSMDVEMGIDVTKVPPVNQGFITSEGKFVNRVEAYYIAYRAGQIEEKKDAPRLFSEDLW